MAWWNYLSLQSIVDTIAFPRRRTLVIDASVTFTLTLTENYDLILINNVTVANDFILTLPLSATAGQGRQIKVKDNTGSCAANSTITVQRAGADTIDGGAGYLMNTAYAYITLAADGVTRWGRQ